MVKLKKTLFVIVSVVLSGALCAAERLSMDILQERFSKQSDPESLQKLTLTDDLNWQLKLLKRDQESDQTYLTYQQSYHGIPVWNKHVIVATSKEGDFKQGYGELFKDMSSDLKKSSKYEKISAEKAKQDFLNTIQNEDKQLLKSSAEKIIYIDKNDQAHFAYKIQWMTVQNNGKTKVEKTLTIVDQNLSVLAMFDALQHATLEGGSGPSGNNKVPRTDYLQEGYQSYPPTTFVVEQSDDGQGTSVCEFDALDVDTRNSNHDVQTPVETYSYDCTESTFNDFKAYNTAKSPLNDAHHYAQVTQLMFQDYLGLKAFNNEKIVQHVHFGQNMDQAFYEDGQVYYGDGDLLFYPMVALDVVAHEIAHGYTEEFGTNSKKQMLTGQARAINEAFSDMTGEAVEYFLRGSNDWRANFDAYQFEGALRYFDQPTQDGVSIDHIKDYDNTVSAHHGAGIFNKAFFQLLTQTVDSVESNPWTPKYGFVVFAKANRHCWTATSTFQEAAQCVLNQASSAANSMATDSVYKSDNQTWQSVELKNHIRKAFAQVGINLVVGAGIESDFSTSQSFLSAQFNNITRKGGQQISLEDQGWQWLWSFGEFDEQGAEITSTQFSPSHTYVTAGNFPVSLTATGPSGGIDVYQIMLNTWNDYCAVSGGNEDRYFIDSVTINGQTKTSGSSTYSNFTADPIDVISGGQFNLEIKAGSHESTNDKSKRFYVWIDSNSDGIFHKTDELAYNGTATDKVNTFLSVAGQVDDIIRVRVISSFGLLTEACGNFTWGEAEDYSLKISSVDTAPTLDIQIKQQVNHISFDNKTIDGRIHSWQWDFDDGSAVNNEVSPTHWYQASGDYHVVAKALDFSNKVLASWEKDISYTTTTTALFEPSISNRSVSLNVEQSIMPAGTTVHWDFGDNDTSTQSTINHQYQQDGNYTITLTLVNPDNPQGVSLSKDVYIFKGQYQPIFQASYVENQDGSFTVTFDNSSAIPENANWRHKIKMIDAKLEWSFGDGIEDSQSTTDFDKDNSHNYAKKGSYIVKLSITYRNTWEKIKTASTEINLELKSSQAVEYCQASGLTDYEHISEFMIVGSDPFSNGIAGGVVNPENPIQLQAGVPIDYRLLAGYSGADKYAENYHIWIDLNGDGLFGDGDWRNDKSERLVAEFDQVSGETGTGEITGSFTIPTHLVSSDQLATRMRIMQYYDLTRVNSIDPCSDYSNSSTSGSGEIEDYLIVINK
ncbi:hypothetical protein CJF42_00625 [Pseudoalteromonas sp. NBT06-2]|uniref:PKD domain-containing protein n=1 Tax=Pseudoalteromonas sp. NBT06-2 TaxID=2025950 RepID=UPI000BA5B645|nr:PKD domain-containing protein [Pseudoalteromonas sp. NBT06-2]PAJ76232.1 hypothetical protein CJF42_00625 [Pseudoalteromonas sp. NBT06-2]